MRALQLLRLVDPTRPFLSADVFEQAFVASLEQAGLVVTPDADAARWAVAQADRAAVAAPAAEQRATAEAFGRVFGAYDLVCPDYRCFAAAPLLMALRNQARSSVAFCLIAHSPGLYALEWALLGPLLTPRDLIIAPTAFARDTICALNGELATATHIAAHPAALTPPAARVVAAATRWQERPVTLLSLARLTPAKLIHRQLDALALLRDCGYRHITLQIAGQLHDPATQQLTLYASALLARTRRLGLEQQVTFLGQIENRAQKIALLQAADLLLNLSVTLEESFGKALVEALSVGTPAVVTRWDGLVEVVGAAGGVVEIAVGPDTGELDVDPAALARTIIAVLERSPDPVECRAQVGAMQPAAAAERYQTLLHAALAHAASWPALPTERPAAPVSGLLSRSAPLPTMRWAELFDRYLAELRSELDAPDQPGSLRQLLIDATAPYLSRLYAYQDRAADIALAAVPRDALPDAAVDALARGLDDPHATTASRLACLSMLDAARLDEAMRERALTLAADRSLIGLIALATLGEWPRVAGLALELTAQPREEHHLILPLLTRSAPPTQRVAQAVQRLLDWAEAFPDHAATWSILLRVVELLDAGDLRLAERAAAYQACVARLEHLQRASPILEHCRRQAARASLGRLFSEVAA